MAQKEINFGDTISIMAQEVLLLSIMAQEVLLLSIMAQEVLLLEHNGTEAFLPKFGIGQELIMRPCSRSSARCCDTIAGTLQCVGSCRPLVSCGPAMQQPASRTKPKIIQVFVVLEQEHMNRRSVQRTVPSL